MVRPSWSRVACHLALCGTEGTGMNAVHLQTFKICQHVAFRCMRSDARITCSLVRLHAKLLSFNSVRRVCRRKN